MVGLRPFSDQNTGLTNQTYDHLTICADQIFNIFTRFSTVSLLVHTQNGQSIFQMADQISH